MAWWSSQAGIYKVIWDIQVKYIFGRLSEDSNNSTNCSQPALRTCLPKLGIFQKVRKLTNRSGSEMNPKFKKLYIVINRSLVIPSVVLSVLMIYDILGPASSFDQVVITGKYTSRDKLGIDYNIRARGNFKYDEVVGKDFYDSVCKGDVVRVALSKFFSECKSLELVRDREVVIKTVGTDIYGMGIFGIALLFTLWAFRSEDKLLSSGIYVLVILSILNVVTVGLWARFVLVWMDVIEKM